jgi:type IV fimbrial biogenesis protein FimT
MHMTRLSPLLPKRVKPRQVSGFSLIEVMVTLAILAILALAALPAFTTWIANSRVRAAAEDMSSGLRLAQTEAVSRSRQTVFALTDAQNPSSTADYTADGSNWVVSIAQSAMDPKNVFVRGSAIANIGTNVIVTGPAAICFSPLGRLVNESANATGVGSTNCEVLSGSQKAQIYTFKSVSSAGDHPLQIEVGLGGQVRLCNPGQTLGGSTSGAAEGCEYSP